MEEDVEKAMDIEEEYDYKDDVTKPLKLEKKPEKTGTHDEIKANDDSNHDNIDSETIPLTDSKRPEELKLIDKNSTAEILTVGIS